MVQGLQFNVVECVLIISSGHTHLSSMSHGIEGEEVTLSDLELVSQVL